MCSFYARNLKFYESDFILYLRLSEGIVAILLQRIYRFTFRFVLMICKISKMLKKDVLSFIGKNHYFSRD